MERNLDQKTKRLALAGQLCGATLLLTLLSIPLPSGYGYVNLLSVTHATGTVPLGVGPILFGLFYMGIDTGLIALKHLLGRIVADARAKASQPADHGKGNQK